VKFAVDPWDPSYGAGGGGERRESAAPVALDVELPATEWRPIVADPAVAPPASVLFVDGVRRVDAQVWVEEPGRGASPALCASYAAGVVCCCQHEGAHLIAADVRRGLFTTATATSDIVTAAGRYRAIPIHAGTDDGQLLGVAVQTELARAERDVAAAARGAHRQMTGGADGNGVIDEFVDDLLVVDGPLDRRQHLPRAIGFVKTHRSEYLPARLGNVVAALRSGERTPVFRLGSSWERHTWYLRLPCRPGTPWAGIVRVECSAELPSDEAIALATRSQVTLVRFASTEYKDPRAPQNLYPIAGLERELRRRLGEPTMLYRALRRAAAAA
jgi:hypothetical protein